MDRSERRAAVVTGIALVVVLVGSLLVLGARTAPQAAPVVVSVPQPVPSASEVPAALPVPTVPPVLVPSGATAPPVPTATAAADQTPVAFTPIPSHRAAVVIDVTGGDEAAARQAVQALDGVLRVAGVTVTTATVGGVPADIAQVDPQEFRTFTPDATANHQPLWDRIAAGDVAVTHEFGTTHDVVLGMQLETGDAGPLRVGAFATNGTPPVADAIVREGTPVGAGTRRLLVALDPEASPAATVEALTDAGLQAEAIPDPRAPRDDVVIPAGGITPDNVWDHLALCESSGNWQINTGNGYYGGVQFLPESWALVGGTGLPHEHPREEQIYRATLLWQIQGWEAWPQCARRLGLIVDAPAPSGAAPAEE